MSSCYLAGNGVSMYEMLFTMILWTLMACILDCSVFCSKSLGNLSVLYATASHLLASCCHLLAPSP